MTQLIGRLRRLLRLPADADIEQLQVVKLIRDTQSIPAVDL